MPRIRELEDLIIDAIYLDILRAKLDQKEQQLEVEYTMGRDLEPGKVESVLATLRDWYDSFIPSQKLAPLGPVSYHLTFLGLQRPRRCCILSIKN